MPRPSRLSVDDSERIFARLTELARETTPFFADVWKRQEKEFGASWAREVAEGASRLLGDDDEERWKEALRGYADFSMDAIRQQKFFEEHRRYQNSSAAGLLSGCYDDEGFMKTTYLPGLFFSHYLWRHHYALLQFFRTEVLPKSGLPGFFYEIGVGTGLYSCETLKFFPSARGKGVDVSKHSLHFAARLLGAGGFLDRYELEQADIFQSRMAPASADFVICQEVLEHLEDPGSLCRILITRVKPKAKAYITAAINAAHEDHIYLFRSPQEVEAMLRAAGWNMVASRAQYAYEGKPVEVTPCVAGFFCQRP